jgi:hypothetical protein
MEPLLEFWQQRLLTSGVDIVHPFKIQSYNAGKENEKDHLPTFGRKSTAAMLIGNSAVIWQPFLLWLRAFPEKVDSENPFDDFLNSVLQGIQDDMKADSALAPLKMEVRLSTGMGCDFVDMLCAARVSGLAYYSESAHLSLHPTFGPWWAMRSVVILDVDFDESLSCPLQAVNPIADLEGELQTLTAALKAKGGIETWKQNWREWVDMRKLSGRHHSQYEYSEDQIEYHYSKNKQVLVRALL